MSNKNRNIFLIFSVFLVLIVATGCAFASDFDTSADDSASVSVDTPATADVSQAASDTSSSDVSSSSSSQSSSADTSSATDTSSSSSSHTSTSSSKDTSSSSSSVITKDTTSASITTKDTTSSSTSSQATQTVKDTDNSDKAQQTTTEKILKSDGEGTFTELDSEIQNAQGTLTLDKNYVRGESEDIITISNDITIDGAGYTIDANQLNGTFIIPEGTTVVLENMILTNAYTSVYEDYYASIIVGGNVTINNLTFTNNNFRYSSVINTTTTGNLSIYDSYFYDNYAQQGMIRTHGPYALVENCVFENNTSANGCIYVYTGTEDVVVNNSKFLNNYASNYGAGIQVYRGSTYVYNTEFINNTANDKGGAVYIVGTGSHTYENCVFINNTVNGTASNMANIQGGAIAVRSNTVVTFKNNTMSGNSAYNGSDIYLDSNAKITPVFITVDDSQVAEGEVATVTAHVADEMGNTVTGGTITFTVNGKTYSSYVQEGVAEYNITDNLAEGSYEITAEYSYVSDDVEATYTTGTLTIGEGLFNYAKLQALIDEADAGSTITISDDIRRGSSETNVTVNKDITIDLSGFAIDANNGSVFVVEDGATLTIENTAVNNIYAQYGGFAYVDTGKLVLNNVTIENATTTGLGYAVYDSIIYISSGSSLDMNNTVIRNISGAVLNLVGSASINNSMISNVNASAAANGVIILTGQLTVNNSFIGNTTSLSSAIYGQTQSLPLTIDNTLFYNNTARSGSGAAILNSASTTITNSVFIANTQTNSWSYGGGAIYVRGDLSIDKCIFINNTAAEKGSIIYNAFGNVKITNSALIPTGEMTAVYTDTGASTTLDYNWWGTNSDPSEYANTAINNWIVMTTTLDPEDVQYLTTVTITTTFDKYTDSTGTLYDYTDTLPDGLQVTYTSTNDFNELENTVTTVIDGKTTNTIKIYESTTLEVTQAAQTNTFDIEVTMPEPTIYVVYEDNFYDFFNEDGTIIKDNVIPYSELQFAGTISNKVIVLDQALNFTSYAQNPVNFQNVKIDIVDGAQGSNITNFTITNTDYSEYAVGMFNVSDVTFNNNVITVTNQEDKVRAIYLNGSERINIIGNTIITNGPSNSITYDDNSIGFADTISIFAFNSSYNVIDSNYITTGFTNVINERYGYDTIVGIDIHGAIVINWTTFETTYYYSDFNEITNNIIITNGNNYTYGINIGAANNNKIQGNTINSTSPNFYAAGIQVSDGSQNNVLTENNIDLKATNITYGIILQSGGIGPVTDNEVSYNTITAESNTVYLIELYQADDNKVSYNNLKSGDANIAMGIGLAKSSSNTISYNEIDVYGRYNDTPVGGDYLPPMNTGIGSYNSTSNTITNNNVESSVGVGVNYAVDLNTTTSSTVTDNFLVSTGYTGDNSVYSESDTNTIKDNTPTMTLAVDGTTVHVTVNLGDVQDGSLILKINGITVKDDGKVVYIPIENGVAEYDLQLNTSSIEKNYTITYVYAGSIGTARANQTVTISPQVANVEVSTSGDLKAGNTVTLTAHITDANGNDVNIGRVVFKLNGVSLRYANGSVIYVNVENGYATLTYTIPDNYSAKDYVLTAVFQGNGFARSEGNLTITLYKELTSISVNSVLLSSDNEISITQGENLQLKATIIDESTGSAVKGTTKVAVKLNDKTVIQQYVTDGVIDLTLYTSSFKNPSYTITIIAGENSQYSKSSYNGTLTVVAGSSLINETSNNGTLLVKDE